MGCGCNKRKQDKNNKQVAKPTVKKPLPLITIRKKIIKKG